MAHEGTARRGAGRPTKAVQRQRATVWGGARRGTATGATATLGNEAAQRFVLLLPRLRARRVVRS